MAYSWSGSLEFGESEVSLGTLTPGGGDLRRLCLRPEWWRG